MTDDDEVAMTDDDDAAIDARGLTKAYGSTPVVDGIDIRVPPGTVFGLLGPNGAGKTTTVRMLATLAAPSDGTARVAGADVVHERSTVRRRISVSGQYVALDQLQTGRENLTMVGRLQGLGRRAATARTAELLRQFELTDAGDRRVATYSGGLRRRLDLAASLVRPPHVLFLDEPTTGLDPRARQGMWVLLAEMTATGVTVFLTTQYLEEADRLAERIAVLDHGRIVAEGTAAELKAAVGGQRLELRCVDPAAFDAVVIRAADRLAHSDPSSLAIGVAYAGAAPDVRRLLDELDPRHDLIAEFSLRTATLDDAFLAFTAAAAPSPSPEEVAAC